MKTYKINSKMYVSTIAVINDSQSIVIPKKGTSITIMLDSIPLNLEVLKEKKLIEIVEID